MNGTAIATVVAKNFLPFARVWACSIRKYHPDVPLFVMLADEPDHYFDPEAEPFRFLYWKDLEVPNLAGFLFANNRAEAVVAAKPYVLSHLLEMGYRNAIFLDADIQVLDSLKHLSAIVAEHALTLTPHFLEPPKTSDWARRELNILQSGIFNGGFVGVSNASSTFRFLDWWKERQWNYCRHEVSKGMHYDQRWLDFAPSFVEDTFLLRDPAYNVAYWNFPERNPDVCAFFHFSGFDPGTPNQVTRYRPAWTVDSLGSIADLFTRYAALVNEAGYTATRNWPYTYGRFRNGSPIPEVARQSYRKLGDRAYLFDNPFETFFDWLTEPADDREPAVTQLWKAVYEARPDVQAAFPDAFGSQRVDFLNWTYGQGIDEHGIDQALLAIADRPVEPVS